MRGLAANNFVVWYFFHIMKSTEQSNDDRPALKSVPDAARAALDAADEAALLFDPQAALLLDANMAGREVFPASGTEQPLALDGAMPAVCTLRAIAQSGTTPVATVPLVFWTAQGIRTLAARVETFRGPGGRILLLARAVPRLAKGAAPAELAGGSPPRSDDQTMQEIARRIHEGQRQLMAPAEPTTMHAAAAEDAAPRRIDVAKLAHELKTPLSAIAAASEIMKEGRFGQIDNERYAGYIADIHESARHALDLIERMLNRRTDLTASPGPDFKFEKIMLDDLVETCLSTVRPLASAKGLSLTTRYAKTAAVVTADATALKQIVLNLIANAIKFTPSGGAITVTTVGSPRGAAVVTVEDTGPGMTAVAVAEALRPVPLDVPRVREGGGLGLGLPMSKSLAQAMGAQLSIDSAPGRGTRVSMTFPGGPLLAI